MVGLADVYWIGGGSGAGKSTIAGRIAERHGFAVYDCDAVMADHAARAADQCPLLRAFASMTMDERWVLRSPGEMCATFHWFAGEAFELIIDDLARLPDRPVVVDGFRLLPHLVAPLLSGPRRAVWLLPTPAFRLEAFTRRGSLWDIAGRSTDPERALANLLERDRLFTDRLRAEVADLQLAGLEVDVAVSEDELAESVEALFGLRHDRRCAAPG